MFAATVISYLIVKGKIQGLHSQTPPHIIKRQQSLWVGSIYLFQPTPNWSSIWSLGRVLFLRNSIIHIQFGRRRKTRRWRITTYWTVWSSYYNIGTNKDEMICINNLLSIHISILFSIGMTSLFPSFFLVSIMMWSFGSSKIAPDWCSLCNRLCFKIYCGCYALSLSIVWSKHISN